jgi:membrane-bound lytic murein transglycosylase D
MRANRAARWCSALGVVIAQTLAVGSAGAAPQRPAHPGAKPGAKKPPPAKPGKPNKHAATRKAGEPGEPDEAARRAIAGTPHAVRESPELRAMRELDRALFPPATPNAGTPWVAEGTPVVDHGEPQVFASGLPPEAPPETRVPLAPEPLRDLGWLRKLQMPDLPVRWDARIVRYLEFYKNNPRGRSMVAGWVKKSGRYGGAIRRVLRENGLPEDIVWLALVESGFDPTIQSPAGAAGLWQFMPDGARIYGLAVDRWIDERLDPERSTIAAARYLADLHTRFGTWELAFAAYNMGYGGLLASIRKYNTNDFWELSRLESGMPLETALYVPKIVAMAIVAKNRAVFGIDDVELDPAVSFDKVSVRPGVSLESIALAAGTSIEKVAELNPQLTASRAPPVVPAPGAPEPAFAVRVPPGTAAKAAQSLPAYAQAEAKLERHVVRWGETVEDIATRHRTTRGMLASVNAIRRDESLRPGTVVLVPLPRGDAAVDPNADAPSRRPVVVVPAQTFAYPDRRRIFYRVVAGDGLRDVADLFGVTADEICRWNALDPTASLHDGMALQIFTRRAPEARPDVLVLDEKDAHVLAVGSPEFFRHFEGLRGRVRLEIVAREGDTWRSIATKYGLHVAQLERINGRARSTPLHAGDKLVVYAHQADNAKAPAGTPKPARDPLEEKAPDLVFAAHPVDAALVGEEAREPHEDPGYDTDAKPKASRP